MRKSILLPSVFSCSLILITCLVFTSCYDFVNPVDPGAGDNYQGYTVYDDSALFELISPVDGTEILFNIESYDLVCSEITGETQYFFDVASDEDFTTFAYIGSSNTNSFTISPVILEQGATYYWRAKPAGGEFTEARSFTIHFPEIGDSFGGGILFYMDDSIGLVAAEIDQSNGIGWDGAVSLCSELELNGFSDWFLPSKEELDLMYENLHLQGLGDFRDGEYWSSSETGSTTVCQLHFGHGGWDNYTLKTKSYRARAARTVSLNSSDNSL